MGDGKWVKMVEKGPKWVTIQMCHIPNAWAAKKKTPVWNQKLVKTGQK